MRSTKFLYIITGLFLLASLGVLAFLVVRGVSKPQSAIPSQAVGTTTDPTKCQGNPNAVAKCFDCNKDAGASQVNILDFACFTKFYGQNVGK
jgi:hypothetical protein